MITDVVVKALAVIGSGAGGGLGLGLLARLLLHTMTLRKPPRWSVQVVRLLGGLICAWLAALWVFSGGGSGIGGEEGLGFGGGAGQANDAKPAETSKEKSIPPQTPDTTLRIEVLGRDALSESDFRAERWYRLETAEGPRLLTFAEIKDVIQKRQQGPPLLRRLEIVLYKDSPDERVPIVSQLRSWASEQSGGKMQVDLLRPDRQASRKP